MTALRDGTAPSTGRYSQWPRNRKIETKVKNSIIFLILILFTNGFVFAQPGAYSGILKFKVYKDGKIIDLANKNWKVITGKYTYSEKQKSYQFPDFYQITPKETPMGGMVAEDFYLDIIFKKDTMKIFTPSFSSKDVILDSIPFIRGIFKIPQHIYDLKYLTDHKFEKYTPKINGNWNLFKKENYRCLIEKVEDLDAVNSNLCARYTDFDEIIIEENQYYYFKNNVIIKPIDTINKSIYQIKDVNEVSFWNTRFKENRFFIKSLFYKDKCLFAIIEKTYNSIASGTTYGIYKLYFIDDEVPKELALYLEKKQLIEDYNAVIKFINQYPRYWQSYTIDGIKSEYEKKIKSIKE